VKRPREEDVTHDELPLADIKRLRIHQQQQSGPAAPSSLPLEKLSDEEAVEHYMTSTRRGASDDCRHSEDLPKFSLNQVSSFTNIVRERGIVFSGQTYLRSPPQGAGETIES